MDAGLKQPNPAGSVQILLATYQGSAYLSEFLDSLERQTHENWTVLASDDGSSDGTLEILRTRQSAWGDRLICLSATGVAPLGSTGNFSRSRPTTRDVDSSSV